MASFGPESSGGGGGSAIITASTEDAQAGIDDTTFMTPLKVSQAISALTAPGTLGYEDTVLTSMDVSGTQNGTAAIYDIPMAGWENYDNIIILFDVREGGNNSSESTVLLKVKDGSNTDSIFDVSGTITATSGLAPVDYTLVNKPWVNTILTMDMRPNENNTLVIKGRMVRSNASEKNDWAFAGLLEVFDEYTHTSAHMRIEGAGGGSVLTTFQFTAYKGVKAGRIMVIGRNAIL